MEILLYKDGQFWQSWLKLSKLKNTNATKFRKSLLAAVQGVIESYKSIKILMDKVQLHNLDFKFPQYLKCPNIALGQQPGAFHHTCPYLWIYT